MADPAKEPKAPRTIDEWVQTAQPGDRFVYARFDRQYAPSAYADTRAELRAAYALFQAGLVVLFQRREKSGALAYTAQKRSAPCQKKSDTTAASAQRPRKSVSGLRGSKTGRTRSTSSATS